MAIQVIPANPRRSSTGEAIGTALGQALSAGLQIYGQHQKQKRYGEALKGIEDIYSDPEMSQEQKFIKSFSALKEFPEVQKQFASGLSQFSETPLQKAQRQKLEQETNELRGEEDYLTRLTGGGKTQQPSKMRPDMSPEMGEEPTGMTTPKRAPAQKEFNYNDPSTWTNKQIDEFRAIEGKSAKAKTLAKRAQFEFDRRQESTKANVKYQENVAPYKSALKTIDKMEKLGAKGNLGIGTSLRGIISPKTRKDAGEYERLGKSLISLASTIQIRNEREFETLSEDLFDPSISDDKRAGILEGMKTIITDSMEGYVPPEESDEGVMQAKPQARKPAQKERPPLTSFLR